MTPLRTLATVLIVFLVGISLSACSVDKATQAKLAIGKFNAECPAQMKTQFAGNPGIAVLGDAVQTRMSIETCNCMTARLEKLPAEKIVALDNQQGGAPDAEVQAQMTPCVAIATKPHMGALCMAAVKQNGGDPDVARPRCECVQRKVDAMDEATVESTFANIDAGFGSLAQACANAE